MTFEWRRRRERDLEDELQGHLEMAVRDRIERGEHPSEAAFAARREFGNVGVIKEVTRDAWGWTSLDSLLHDVRYGVRAFAKSPGFSLIVVLTLALGIGANTAIFSAARAVFVRALPYPDWTRLAFVSRGYPGFPQGGGNFSYPAYRDMLEQNRSFDVLAAYQDFGALVLTDGAEPLRVRVCYVTPSYLRLTGATTVVGRTLRDDEDRFGDGAPVAVISYGLWQRRYSGAADIVGRTIRFNQQPFTVVGVAAESFRDAPAEHEDPEPVDAWVPLGRAHSLTAMSGATDRVGAIIWGVGHLKAGVSIEAANADLAAIAGRLAREHPTSDAGYSLVARPLRDQLIGEFYSPVWLLIAGAGFILLIGCANGANLLLSRLLARRREFAVRAALGASARRLAQQLLVENLLLTFVAGAVGLVAAVWGVAALQLWAARHLPVVVQMHVDGWMLVVSTIVSTLTGLLFALGPAISGTRVDVRDALAQGGRQGDRVGRRAAAKALVVAEVALAMGLLVGAGLLLKSLHRLTSTNLGFDTANLLTLRMDLRSARYQTPADRARFGRILEETIRGVPAVTSVTLWGPSMLGRATWVMDGVPEGRDRADQRNILTFERHSVNPGGLANLGIALLRGRDFTEHDAVDAPMVAIISQSLAYTWWPGEDAIGKRFFRPTDPAPMTVIGIAADARHRQRFTLADAAIGIPPAGLGPQRDAYFAYSQRPNAALVVAVRTSGDPGAVTQALRKAVIAIDPAMPVYDIALLDTRLADQDRASRVLTLVTVAYAALALFLAAFGLFGVLAHAVRGRTQEIGIRMALGGLPRDVLAMVLREGLGLAGVGLVCGLIAAAVLSRLMSGLLFGVSPNDPGVYVGIAIVLIAIATAACWIPARRATRVDPLVALRYE